MEGRMPHPNSCVKIHNNLGRFDRSVAHWMKNYASVRFQLTNVKILIVGSLKKENELSL
jgi:hypothetical protein